MKAIHNNVMYTLLLAIALQPTLQAMEELDVEGGGEQNESLMNGKTVLSPEKKSLAKKLAAGLIALLVVAGTITGVAVWGNSGSNHDNSSSEASDSYPVETTTGTIPSNNCPHKIPLNDLHYCNKKMEDLPYWEGVQLAEATLSGKCIRHCIGEPNIYDNSFRKPVTIICDDYSDEQESLLRRLYNASVCYARSGLAFFEPVTASYTFYTYDSADNFTLPEHYFTVDEVESSPRAMSIIQEWFEFSQAFYPNDCKEWELVPFSATNDTSFKMEAEPQKQYRPRNKKKGNRSTMKW